MSKTLVGIEITEESVQAVEVSRGPRPVILAAGEVSLPPNAARDSEIIDPQAVALAITQLWQQTGIRNRTAVLGVGSRRILVREHVMPTLPREQLREALPYHVEGALPVPVEQAVLDFYPISEQNNQTQGLLVAAISENIEALVETLREAKVTASSVDLIPFGLSRVAARLSAPDETVAMLYVGYHTSYIVILSHGVPAIVRIISLDLSPQRTAEHGLESEESLEAELYDTTLPEPEPATQTRNAAHRAAVIDLASRVRATLQYYEARGDAPPVDRVLISGAGMLHGETRHVLNEALGLPSEIVSTADLADSNIPLDADLPLVLLSTLGLALEGSGK